MNSKLILVEGLPGFGKSTAARLVSEVLEEINAQPELVLEGDLDHPADYDGVAYFTKEQLFHLDVKDSDLLSLIMSSVIQQGEHYLLPYRKMIQKYGSDFPDDLYKQIAEYDVYELLLYQNMQLITSRWQQFAERALLEQKTYIFDCCFIQNPVTIAMIKYGASEKTVTQYVNQLASTIIKLNPLVIYIDQDDLEGSFKKAVIERPKEWSEGFIQYYTNQWYGQSRKYEGIEGTLQILKERYQVEMNIYDQLTIPKVKVNNSEYDRDRCKQELSKVIQAHLDV
ncbi:hypothetical protein [Paenibacillus marinisediminis]